MRCFRRVPAPTWTWTRWERRGRVGEAAGLRARPRGTQRLLFQAGGSTGLLMDLAANEKAVHADFFNGEDCRAPRGWWDVQRLRFG